MSKNYLIYYQKPSLDFRAYDSKTKQLRDFVTLPKSSEYSRFFVTDGYSANDEGLVKYVEDFQKWVTELKTSKVLKIYYTNYGSHHVAIESTFKRLAKGTSYESHEEIDKVESKWMEKCYNTGLMYCKPGKYKCYGYDFSLYYPSLLASEEFRIPKKRGKEVILKKLTTPDKLQVGYYHVKITCANEEFKKLFSFSKDHVYTHHSLKTAFKHQNEFDVKINLVQEGDNKANSYLYDIRHCTTGREIFGNWYDKIVALREEFPNNKLIKMLGSRLWGHLTKNKKTFATADEIQENEMDVGLDDSTRYKIIDYKEKSDGTDYYTLFDTENPYFYNIRIKALLTAAGRAKTAEVVSKNLKHVVKVQTDGIVMTKEMDKAILQSFDKLSLESKSTGLMELTRINQPKSDYRLDEIDFS